LTGSNWRYGVRRCDGNSDSVSVNANCLPHALGFGDVWCTCQSVIYPRVINTDPDMLWHLESSYVNGYMAFGVCPMPWLLFYYLFIYLLLLLLLFWVTNYWRSFQENVSLIFVETQVFF
jgi:hypothetical protein